MDQSVSRIAGFYGAQQFASVRFDLFIHRIDFEEFIEFLGSVGILTFQFRRVEGLDDEGPRRVPFWSGGRAAFGRPGSFAGAGGISSIRPIVRRGWPPAVARARGEPCAGRGQ